MSKKEQFTTANSWANEVAETEKPQTEKSKFGKGSRSRRTESRAKKFNTNTSSTITAQSENRLGISSTDDILSLKPAYALRPTGIHINLLASNQNVKEMVGRMTVIAMRPLANLLAVDGNILRYRKVCCYLLFARVCAAQQKMAYCTGQDLPLVSIITSDEFRAIDGRVNVLPNFFAWMLTQIGIFEYDTTACVPLLPHHGSETATIVQALSGNFASLCAYIQHYSTAESPIPPADEESVRTLVEALPISISGTAASRRFSTATVALFQPVITEPEWSIFTKINGALSEQNCTVSKFNLSEASGTEVARVRFPLYQKIWNENDYYCTSIINEIYIRSALVMRLGIDQGLPPDQIGSRCMGSANYAVISGHDVPMNYLQAQLVMLKKLPMR